MPLYETIDQIESRGVELRPIIGVMGYSAGSDGNIYTFKRRGAGGRHWGHSKSAAVLRGTVNFHGRRMVQLDGKVRSAARAICGAFHGHCPPGMSCSHLNGDKLDNRPSNLVWESLKKNLDRRHDHGTFRVPSGEEHPHAKLSDCDVADIRLLLESGESQASVAMRFGVSRSHVSRIANGHARV